MKSVLSDTTWTSVNRPEELVIATQWEDVCLIRAKDTSSLLILLNDFNKCQRATVILKYTLRDRAGMKAVFDKCWMLGITDVVVVEEYAKRCYVYSYFPFGKNRCFNTFPVLMKTWEKSRSGSLNISHTFFPDKLSNLFSCPLQVECAKDLEETGFHRRFGGLIPFLLKAMRATPKIIHQVHGAFPKVTQSRTNLLFAQFFQNVDRLKIFEFSPIPQAVITGLCFPLRRKRPAIEWSRIVDEFPSSVWYALIVCSILMIMYVYFFVFQREVDVTAIVLRTLGTLMSISMPQLPVRRWQDKICLPLWLYLCLVLNSGYQSILNSKLTLPFVDETIRSIEEFKKLDLPIHVSYASHKFATETMLTESRHKFIIDKMMLFENTSGVEMMQSYDGSAAYICDNDDIDSYFNGSYRLLRDLRFENLVTLLLLPRPSPYERLFKKSLLRIFDAGAFRNNTGNDFNTEVGRGHRIKGHKALSLRALSGIFMVWILGCCAGTIYFFAEILYLKLSVGIKSIDARSVLRGAIHRKPEGGVHVSRTNKAES